MIDLAIEKKSCTGCYVCSNICPKECIHMENDGEGFLYPKVDYQNCTECKKCTKVCPIINKVTIKNKPLAYACYNKENKIRFVSSSGGIFTLIAEAIINNGGIVFGAEFDKNFRVIHGYTESVDELGRFRGSKYVQSCVGNAYKQAKYFLMEGRDVLFSGTPCQISGLRSFLGKDFDNLFSIDIICHGVPSPKVWEKYIIFRESKAKSKIRKVTFRCKNKGWKKYCVLFLFKNNTSYCETFDKDLYMRTFLKDISLRPSCYNCKFKSLHRQSDITLADFWGINSILPEMDDNKGISLIFINSEKGKDIFEKIKDKIIYKEVDIKQAVKYNPSAVESAKYNIRRNDFFRNLDKQPFDILVKKYCKDTIINKITKLIKNLLLNILRKINF